MRQCLLLVLAACLLAACQPRDEVSSPLAAAARIDAGNIRAHVEFLADDLLEGRETGERGYAIAANYFATQCKLLGLEPAGDAASYFQPVTFRHSRLESATAHLALAGERRPLAVPGDIAVLGSYNARSESVSGELVFVGWGVSAPEFGYDDYAGIDVAGKIAMVVRRGAPEAFPGEERAYYSSTGYKLNEAVAHGAIGVVWLSTPEYQEEHPWERVQAYVARGGLEWIASDGSAPNAYPQLKTQAMLSYARQVEMFEHAPQSFADVMAKIAAGEPASFALPASLEATRRSLWTETDSTNVACMLPGSDPELADEYVLFSGHLDHVGIDESVEEGADRIRNGAYDNAAGIGILLEVARVFASLPEAPRRSLLFLAVTAEEKGLLGSEYWAANPTVPIGKVAANVNIDMPVLTFPLADVIAYGAEHSELGEIVRAQAATQNLTLSPDPWPEEVVFVRSDQYSFVKAGVPAVFLVPGWTSSDETVDGEALMRGFEEQHYHKVSDDLSLPFDRDSARRFAATNFLVGLEVANRDAPVRWKAGDFFGARFATSERMLEGAASQAAGK